MKSILLFALAGLLLSSALASAQEFAIYQPDFVSGAGTSTGSLFAVSGAIHQAKADPMSGSIFTIDGRFLSLTPAIEETEVIFDNTGGEFSGYEFAYARVWLGNKFCVGAQSYLLESVTLRLSNRSTPAVASVQLQIFSDDVAQGRPSINVGPVMNLADETNPIAFPVVAGDPQKNVKWTPATPFIVAANKCYWVVLSADSGEVLTISTSRIATGPGATFGRSYSTDAGATWQPAVTQSNRKMLIRGVAATTPELAISAPKISGSALSFSFHGVSGRTYVIECRTNLTEGVWTTLPETTRVGTGAPIELTLTNALNQSKQFYRVKRLP